jgi:hypothetical protein
MWKNKGKKWMMMDNDQLSKKHLFSVLRFRHSVLVSQELVVFFFKLMLFRMSSPELQRKYFIQKLVDEDSVCFAKISFNLQVANSTRGDNTKRVCM